MWLLNSQTMQSFQSNPILVGPRSAPLLLHPLTLSPLVQITPANCSRLRTFQDKTDWSSSSPLCKSKIESSLKCLNLTSPFDLIRHECS